MNWAIDYASPTGSRHPLTTAGNVCIIPHGGIQGLVGHPTVETSVVGEVPGQHIMSTRTPAFRGSVTLHIHHARNVPEVLGWFSAVEYGVLRLTTPTGRAFSARVRQEQEITPPEANPGSKGAALVTVPLICDDGVWWADSQSEGSLGTAATATITNTGDVIIYPTLTWSTASTTVLPSGAKLELPKPKRKTRTLNLSHQHAGIIMNGTTPDLAMSRTVSLIPEGVPPGETRTLTHTGIITWQIGVWDPWKES